MSIKTLEKQLRDVKGQITEAMMAEGIALHGQLHKLGKEGLDSLMEKSGTKPGKAAALLRLSRDWRLIKYARRLPPDLRLLNRLANLNAIVFEEALRLDIINPGMTREDVERLRAV